MADTNEQEDIPQEDSRSWLGNEELSGHELVKSDGKEYIKSGSRFLEVKRNNWNQVEEVEGWGKVEIDKKSGKPWKIGDRKISGDFKLF